MKKHSAVAIAAVVICLVVAVVLLARSNANDNTTHVVDPQGSSTTEPTDPPTRGTTSTTRVTSTTSADPDYPTLQTTPVSSEIADVIGPEALAGYNVSQDTYLQILKGIADPAAPNTFSPVQANDPRLAATSSGSALSARSAVVAEQATKNYILLGSSKRNGGRVGRVINDHTVLIEDCIFDATSKFSLSTGDVTPGDGGGGPIGAIMTLGSDGVWRNDSFVDTVPFSCTGAEGTTIQD